MCHTVWKAVGSTMRTTLFSQGVGCRLVVHVGQLRGENSCWLNKIVNNFKFLTDETNSNQNNVIRTQRSVETGMFLNNYNMMF